MLSQKVKCFKEHTAVCLEALVPKNNFYRQVEAKLDLSFVREFVQECYATTMGRPSIDPVVFFKLQLIMFFEGIRSERRLVEAASLNLAHRWYLGYHLDEPLPDHSSLTRIRQRLGLDLFQRFFEHVVELCREAGPVWEWETVTGLTDQAMISLLRTAVEHGGQLAGRVGDLARQHGAVVLERADFRRVQPALDDGPSRLAQRPDRSAPALRAAGGRPARGPRP